MVKEPNMNRSLRLVAVALLAWLAGCSTVPDTRIKQPMTARPVPQAVAAENGGAIFQTAAGGPLLGGNLFEDRKPSRIGDTLTINLVEKTNATRNSQTTDERKISGTIDIPAPTLLGKSNLLGATSIDPSSDNKLENTDNRTNSNTVTGTITVTVTDVLPNGNLVVAGEKQVSINNQTEYIRLAGVANPKLITANNSMNSTQLADVQFESKSTQGIDRSVLASMMARFFLTIVPF
jgi:flagellar L-ring protein precursor FlgH